MLTLVATPRPAGADVLQAGPTHVRAGDGMRSECVAGAPPPLLIAPPLAGYPREGQRPHCYSLQGPRAQGLPQVGQSLGVSPLRGPGPNALRTSAKTSPPLSVHRGGRGCRKTGEAGVIGRESQCSKVSLQPPPGLQSSSPLTPAQDWNTNQRALHHLLLLTPSWEYARPLFLSLAGQSRRSSCSAAEPLGQEHCGHGGLPGGIPLQAPAGSLRPERDCGWDSRYTAQVMLLPCPLLPAASLGEKTEDAARRPKEGRFGEECGKRLTFHSEVTPRFPDWSKHD